MKLLFLVKPNTKIKRGKHIGFGQEEKKKNSSS